MSREDASVAAGRGRARARHETGPSADQRSRAVSRATGSGCPQPAGRRVGARVGRRRALCALAAGVLLAVALLLGTGAIRAGGLVPWVNGPAGRGRAAPSAAPTVDPRLILVPRTVSQSATAGGVEMELMAGPLLPGSNHFALRLVEAGRPLGGVHVALTARMEEMAMAPLTVPMSEGEPGAYAATGPLPMFGAWQLTVQIARPGAAAITHQFTVSVDLPPGLLTTPANGRSPGQ